MHLIKRVFQKVRDSGAFWMLMASLLFSVMGVCVKLGAAQFSTAELVFYRCFIGFLVIGCIVVLQKKPLATPVPGLQLTRAISGTIALMMYFYGIAHLPLATAVTLNYTSPLFLALLTVFWMKERLSRTLVLAMIIGFCGVGLVLQPTIERSQWFAGVVGLASGFLAGIAILNVRRLGQAGEPEWRTVFYFSLVASIFGLGWMLSGPISEINTERLILILAMGGSATGAQLAMTRAYRKGQSLAVATLAYATVVFSSAFGVMIWGDPIHLASLIGVVLIMVSGLITTVFRLR